MLAVRDTGTQAQLLAQLLIAIESGESTVLQDFGVPSVVLDLLRDLKGFEIARLLGRDLGFSVQLDHKQLVHEVRVLKDQIERQTALEYFIARGATTSLIQHVFRLSRSDIVATKKMFTPMDKVSSIPTRDRERIETMWIDLRGQHAPNSAGMWIALGEAFPDYTLATLHNVITSFERLGN